VEKERTEERATNRIALVQDIDPLSHISDADGWLSQWVRLPS
jgi:hypothetical protein